MGVGVDGALHRVRLVALLAVLPMVVMAIPAMSVAQVVQGPAIELAKTASPTALTHGPGTVTYTYTVTNPGTVLLNGVSVTDDKLGAITFVSGDVNTNTRLDPGETWIFRATTVLTGTTSNIATATATAVETRSARSRTRESL
jgi:uncharacterized repeat protein (TIGR01451 family)